MYFHKIENGNEGQFKGSKEMCNIALNEARLEFVRIEINRSIPTEIR